MYVLGGFLWLVVAIVFSYAGFPLLGFLIFQGTFWVFFLLGLAMSSGNLFIVLRSLDVVGMNSNAFKYCSGYSLDVCARILFVTASDCLVSSTSHIPVFLFLLS